MAPGAVPPYRPPVVSSSYVRTYQKIELTRRPRPDVPKPAASSAVAYRPFGPLRQKEGMSIFDFFETEDFWKKALPKGVTLTVLAIKDPEAVLEWNQCKGKIEPFLRVYSDRRVPGSPAAPQAELDADETEESAAAMQGRSSLSPAEIAAFEQLQRRLNGPALTARLVSDLRKATIYMERVEATRPIPSPQDPADRDQALKKAANFPRLDKNSRDAGAAEALFEKHWQRPTLLRVLRLGDFETHDPTAYSLLVNSERNPLFNRLHRLRTQPAALMTAMLARPHAASPQSSSAPA
jgi:hypothetical protein